MNVTSGSINDNPWASVPREDEESASRNNIRRHANNSNNSHGDPRFATCTDWTLHQLVRVLLGVDAITSIVLLILGMAYLWQPHHASTVFTAIFCGQVGLCLGFRAMSVTASLYYSHIVDRSGFLLASYVSLGLSMQSMLVTLLAVLFRTELRHRSWWAEHFTLTQLHSLLHNPSLEEWFLHKVEPWLWLILISIALLEWPFRWRLYQHYRHRLLQQEEADLQQTTASLLSTAERRPWWWTTPARRRPRPPLLDLDDGNDLRRNLLEDTTTAANNIAQEDAPPTTPVDGIPTWARDHGTPLRSARGQRAPPQSLFSSWFFWKNGDDDNNDDHNLRDDGSVDFASVQEEWQSRSDEDPLWWSRQEARASPQRSQQQTTSSRRPMNNPQDAVPDFVSSDDAESVATGIKTSASTTMDP